LLFKMPDNLDINWIPIIKLYSQLTQLPENHIFVY